MKAFDFEALLGSLHCLLSQLQRSLQALPACTNNAGSQELNAMSLK